MLKKIIVLTLLVSFIGNATVFAGLGSKKAAYQGGTTKDKDFAGAKEGVEGNFIIKDETALKFDYEINKVKKTFSIPYSQFIDVEYGQKAGRRVGAALATAILISPVGLFLLFSKKRKHFVTIGYKGEDGKDQVAIFEVGKDIIRESLAVLETRSGKKVVYQDEEAKKSSSKGK